MLKAVIYSEQVTWLVVTEVRSESFGLVTEYHHYNGRAMRHRSYFCLLDVVVHCNGPHIFHCRVWWEIYFYTFSVLCVYSKFRHHPHPLGYLCAKLRFCGDLRCWASPWKTSRTQSLNHSLYDASGTAAFASENLYGDIQPHKEL